MSCAHCEELEDRVAWLESELGLRASAELTDLLRRELHLTPSEGHLLMRLYLANGRLVTLAHLEEAIPPLDRTLERDPKIVRVYVSRLRIKLDLGREAVRLSWGRGYALSDAAIAKVRAVLTPQEAAA